MADRKSRKKNKKYSNKSSGQKKINKPIPEDRNSNSRSDPSTNSRSDQRTNERSSSRGRISTCYQMVVSRITRPFGRGAVANKNEGATTTVRNEGRLNDGPPCQPSVPEPKLDRTKQNRNGKMATTHQRELYDAVQELLSPKKPAIISDVPSVKISFSIKFHSNITSVLIEMLNNIPDLHDTSSENDEWPLLRKLLRGGSFADFSQDREKIDASSSARNNREENKRRRRRRLKMVMFLAKASSILTTATSLCSLLPTRTENVHPSRNDLVMQPPEPSLPEVAQFTTQKTSPKQRAPTRIATQTLPNYSVKRPISKGGSCSWTNVKARNNTILVNQMTKMKAAQSYRDDKMVQPSLAQTILHSVQSKVLRKRVSAMATERTVLINAMQKPMSNSSSNLPNRYNTRSTTTIRTAADFPRIQSLKETRMFGLLQKGREAKPCVGVPETANTHSGQLVRSTECVRISCHFECEKQTFLLDKNLFWSMLEVLQNEYVIQAERTASDAFTLPSFSADTVSSRETHGISITVKLPGSTTLQVSSVPVSLLQRLIQRLSEGSMVPFTNRYRATYTRNFTNAEEAKTASTGSFSPRYVTAVRGLGERLRPIILPDEAVKRLRPIILPDEAVTAVSSRFMEMNIDKEVLPFYKELEYPGNCATFTRQAKRRPIAKEPVTAVAEKQLELNEYIQKLVIYQEIYSTEKENAKAIIKSDTACAEKLDLEMEATKSTSKEDQDKTNGSETKTKEDIVDKKVLNVLAKEGIADDRSLKCKLFDDTGETRKPNKIYQKRINYYSLERLPTIPEEPEDQDNFTQCEFARIAVKVDEPTDGAWMNDYDHGKLSATCERRDHMASKGEKSKEYKEFDTNVPSHLGHIEIPFTDITDVVFEKDEEGEPLILSSGGFGDIYQARLVDTNETVIVKTIEDMDFEEILRETRIQMYLMPGQYVPAIKGIIAVQGQPEIMILQQYCAGGRTLYDVIDACMVETLTLLDSHWLQLAYKLVLSYENMHRKGVLHNDIKSDNILVELKPYDAQPYLIDFGMATFRKGGRLILPTDIPECGSEEEHLAPEVRHSQPSSPKSDIYSLGKVFQEMAYFCNELGLLSQDMCSDNPADRPTLEEIADELEDIMVEKDL